MLIPSYYDALIGLNVSTILSNDEVVRPMGCIHAIGTDHLLTVAVVYWPVRRSERDRLRQECATIS